MRQERLPALRAIEIEPVQHEGREYLLLRDPRGISPDALLVPAGAAHLLRFFDGRHTLADLQLALTRASGEIVSTEQVRAFAAGLDAGLMLDTPTFHERRRELAEAYRRLPHRPTRFAGTAYAADAATLVAELDAAYDRPDGPGRPGAPATAGCLAIAAPHIDPARGAAAYAHAYAALWGARPERVVLLGVNHAGSRAPFVLTTRDYATPLGVLPTDTRFVEQLAARLEFDPLEEEELHGQEHSVEFQVLYLQHALACGSATLARPPRAVPILCSFPWQIWEGALAPEPVEIGLLRGQVEAFLRALRDLAAEEPEGLLWIAGVDLAHVGRRFGDAAAPAATDLARLRERDLATLATIAAGDRAGLAARIVAEGDDRRLCGVTALHSLLALIPGARGRLLHYGQAVEEAGGSVVSFAALRFDA